MAVDDTGNELNKEVNSEASELTETSFVTGQLT